MKLIKKKNVLSLKVMRKLLWTKLIIFFGLFAFLFVSCNPNIETVTIDPADRSIADIISNDGVGLYNTMELFRSVSISNSIKSPEDLLSFFSGKDSDGVIAEVIDELDKETTRFNEVGYASYIQEKVDQKKLSVNMKEWLMSFESTVLAFMETKPNENEFMSYFSDINNFNYSLALTLDETSFVTKTLKDAKEYAKYYYLHYSMDDDGARDADCNFFKALGCGILFVAIVVVILLAIWALLVWALSAITAAGGTIIVNGVTAEALAGATAIEAILFLIFDEFIPSWTKSFFEWCCGKKEERVCSAPIGSHVQEIGCNRFRYTIFGPGNYSTTIWNNTNTTPNAAISPSPSLVVSIPSIGIASSFKAAISCIALPSGDVSNFEWDETVLLSSDTDFPALEWASAPPQEASLKDLELGDSEIELSVIPANNALYTYAWEVTGEAGIEGSDYNAFLDVWDVGLIGVSVTVTHKCTGESKKLSTIITITE